MNERADETAVKLNNGLLGLYGLAVLGALTYIIFGDASTSSAVGLVAVLMIAPIFLLKTEYGLYTLLIVRPLIDLFAGYGLISYRSINLNVNAVIALMVLVWFLVIVLRERIQLNHLPGLGWLLAFLGWCLATTVVSLDSFITLTEWLRLSSIIVVFMVAYHVAQQRQHAMTRLTPVLAIAMTTPLIVSLVQLLTNSGLSYGNLTNRVYGTFGHPNVLGFYLVCTLSVLLVAQLSRIKQHRSLLYPWLISFGLLMLLFTYTRGAWIGFLLAQFIIGLVYYRKAIITLSAILVSLLVFWQVINAISISTFSYDLNSVTILQRLTSRDEESDSIDWRLQVFETMSPYTLQSPLLGYGLGNFVTLRQQGEIGFFDDPEAHNDYLRLTIETGFVGLGFYLLFWLSLIVTLWRNMRSHQESAWQKRYALLGIALIAAILEMSIGDNLLQGTAVMWTVMAVLGTILFETKPNVQ